MLIMLVKKFSVLSFSEKKTIPGGLPNQTFILNN